MSGCECKENMHQAVYCEGTLHLEQSNSVVQCTVTAEEKLDDKEILTG